MIDGGEGLRFGIKVEQSDAVVTTIGTINKASIGMCKDFGRGITAREAGGKSVCCSDRIKRAATIVPLARPLECCPFRG